MSVIATQNFVPVRDKKTHRHGTKTGMMSSSLNSGAKLCLRVDVGFVIPLNLQVRKVSAEPHAPSH